MNRESIEGNWIKFKNKVTARWGRLANGHPEGVSEPRAALAGKIREPASTTASVMDEAIPPRRIVLRGALAVGTVLLVPAAIFGCDSKSGATYTSAAPASPPASGGEPAVPPDSGKATPASVQYQARPKDGQTCAACLHFVAESNTCQVVEGQVSPAGWCRLWAKRA